MASISLPPPHQPFVDTNTGKVDDAWYRALSQITNGTNAALVSPVAIADGGTGTTSATAAFNALAPSTVPGTITYLTSTGWATLAPGTSTQFLESGTVPAWGSAKQPAAFAYVTFASSYAIANGYNVSSITTTGIGQFDVNFSAGALASSNYATAIGITVNDVFNSYGGHINTQSTAKANISLFAKTSTPGDNSFSIIVFQ